MGDEGLLATADQVASTLARLGVACERLLACPYATPQRLGDYAAHAEERGLRVLIAVGDGHLAATAAARTLLPVIAVIAGPDPRPPQAGPHGAFPVAAVEDGRSAAVLAAQILALHDPPVRRRLARFRGQLADRVQRAHRRWQGEAADEDRPAPVAPDAAVEAGDGAADRRAGREERRLR